MKTQLVKCSDCLRARLAPTCKKENVGLRPLATWQKQVVHLSSSCLFCISMLVQVQSWKRTAEKKLLKFLTQDAYILCNA